MDDLQDPAYDPVFRFLIDADPNVWNAIPAVAKALGLDKDRVARVVRTLTAKGYLDEEGSGNAGLVRLSTEGAHTQNG